MFIQLSIMLLCILLCLISTRVNIKRKTRKTVQITTLRGKYILPICFIIITTFFAIRYDYGLDYWNYYERYITGWTQRQFELGSTEVLFYQFMNSFGSYFNFIIAHTLILMAVLFYMTRKYCDYRYYALFFFILLARHDMATNMISALRVSLAASMLWIGLDLFYIRAKRWLPFFCVIVLAFFVHTSVIVFLVLPLIHVIIMKVGPKFMFTILLISIFFRLSLANDIFVWAARNVQYLQTYEHFTYEKNIVYNFNSILYLSCMLFPSYFVCHKKELLVEKGFSGIYVLAVFFLLLFLTGLDFEGRFSIYLMIFFIYSLCMILPRVSRLEKLIIILPLTLFILYDVYLTYNDLMSPKYLLMPGNTLFYKTIFEARPL